MFVHYGTLLWVGEAEGVFREQFFLLKPKSCGQKKNTKHSHSNRFNGELFAQYMYQTNPEKFPRKYTTILVWWGIKKIVISWT